MSSASSTAAGSAAVFYPGHATSQQAHFQQHGQHQHGYGYQASSSQSMGYTEGGYQDGSFYNPYANYSGDGATTYDRERGAAVSGSASDTESDNSNSSEGSIEIVRGERSMHDGYNAYKNPSGRVVTTASGQVIEFWDGVHIPKTKFVPTGRNGPQLHHHQLSAQQPQAYTK
jgi:hypothetical protein